MNESPMIYKGWIIVPFKKQFVVYSRAGKRLGDCKTLLHAKAAIEADMAFTRIRKRRNPYKHERIISPKTLARRGKTKYRSVKTPRGHVLRLAFPPGKRKRGSGELQAILHKKNPACYVRDKVTGRKIHVTKPVEVYMGTDEIRAFKRNGQGYKHKFRTRPKILGLPDGRILIG